MVVDNSNQRFSGKVAIVTGSTADPSIGRSCALRLAREGASVVVNGRDPSRLASTEAALRSEGLKVTGVVGSMETEAAVEVLVDRAVEAFGGIDLIVSTLGGAPYPLPFDSISETQLLDTMKLNTWPALALIRAALSRGLADGGGSVVTISSGSPRKTTSAMVAYAASKAALNAMTRTIAADLAPRGVRVNAVSPGLVRTTATRARWEADDGRAAGFGATNRSADRSGRCRRCGDLLVVERRSSDHGDHPGRRRGKSPRRWGLDTDPVTHLGSSVSESGQLSFERSDDLAPENLDLLTDRIRRHPRELYPQVECVDPGLLPRPRRGGPRPRPDRRRDCLVVAERGLHVE